MNVSEPYLTNLESHEGKSGSLSFLQESGEFPISIKRVYWIYGVAENADRGNHAHLNADRVIICMQGAADVHIENAKGKSWTFKLTTPAQYVFFPRNHWVKIKLPPQSILVTLASCLFEEDVLEKDYTKFRQADR
ncbi:MAG TPA: FdtA/QdtA family cupin domain-containing protein [Chryseosolibacter sp.]|nr:FdtA/QdtA family cupin domain-containing protein [Chryseosolibacter sp.]